MQRAIAAIGLAQYSPACVFIETCLIQDGNHRQPWHVLLAIETAHMQNLQMFILKPAHAAQLAQHFVLPFHAIPYRYGTMGEVIALAGRDILFMQFLKTYCMYLLHW